jgi:hypothetical protein
MIDLKYVASDVLFAFGVAGDEAWHRYQALAERMTAEIESCERPQLAKDEIGILHKLLKTLDISLDSETVPAEFRAALHRIDIDDMYYGSVRVGMGDLLAIRSIEKPLASHVARRIWTKLEDKPLMTALLKAIRGVGMSQGVQCDFILASEMAYVCLEAAAALAGDGAVTQEDIWRMAEANGFAGRRRLEASSPEGAAE